jgi:hypothetical protein
MTQVLHHEKTRPAPPAKTWTWAVAFVHSGLRSDRFRAHLVASGLAPEKLAAFMASLEDVVQMIDRLYE